MRLKTFNAPDMSVAMRMIREALGDDAIIIASNRLPAGGGVTVTAAAEPPAELMAASTDFAGPQTDESLLASFQGMLRFHSVSDHVVATLIETARHLCLRGKDVYTDLTRLLAACFQYAPLPLDQETFTLMLVGPPGTGKTMTVAKMASQVVMSGHKPVIITTDNKRAGGVEQLSAFTTIMGVELHIADNRGELWKLLREYAPRARILIDTGGVNPFSAHDLRELGEYIKLDRSIDPVLVSAAGSDAGEADDMARAFSALGVRRLLITRIDAARRYGSVLTAAHSGRLAFCHASNSASVVGEFLPLDPPTLAGLILRHQMPEARQ